MIYILIYLFQGTSDLGVFTAVKLAYHDCRSKDMVPNLKKMTNNQDFLLGDQTKTYNISQ